MVHTFAMHGLKLALDVESGALHVLDEPAFLAIKKLADGTERQDLDNWLKVQFGPATALEVEEEISDLWQKGLLFSKNVSVSPAEGGIVKALCLHLAHDCNLRCSYCFAGTGDYGGERGLMTTRTARLAVEFLLSQSAGRRHCEIDFFGGEPLLNFPVLKETVAYGKRRARALDKVLKFTVTTNAVALDKKIRQYLNHEGISVVLSLDGRQEVHDGTRRKPDGSGSYSQVLANCRDLVDGRGDDNYYLRGTYTSKNMDFTRDVLSMINEGFKRISLEPAVLTPGHEGALQEHDLPVLYAEYESLAKLLWERENSGEQISFFHFELDLKKGPCAKKRVAGCGAGSTYLAVSPGGSIYPCHQFVGLAGFCAGHVAKGLDRDVLAPFQAADMEAKDGCRECFARYFCGGGCYAAAWLINNDLFSPYPLACALQRKRVECGLYLQAKRLIRESGW